MAAKKRGIISREEFEDMLEKVSEEQEALLCLLYITGCRISEALLLERKDVTKDKDIYVNMPTLKTRSHIKYSYRLLPLGKNTEYLLPFIKWAGYQKERIFNLTRKKAWDLITKISNNTYTCHDFRHTRATILAGKGYSAFQLQAWFGWKKMDMAEKYVKLSVISKEVLNQMKDNLI